MTYIKKCFTSFELLLYSINLNGIARMCARVCMHYFNDVFGWPHSYPCLYCGIILCDSDDDYGLIFNICNNFTVLRICVSIVEKMFTLTPFNDSSQFHSTDCVHVSSFLHLHCLKHHSWLQSIRWEHVYSRTTIKSSLFKKKKEEYKCRDTSIWKYILTS